jgi:hypothetical protein
MMIINNGLATPQGLGSLYSNVHVCNYKGNYPLDVIFLTKSLDY